MRTLIVLLIVTSCTLNGSPAKGVYFSSYASATKYGVSISWRVSEEQLNGGQVNTSVNIYVMRNHWPRVTITETIVPESVNPYQRRWP